MCIDGRCVGHNENLSKELDLNEICQRRTSDLTSRFYADTPDNEKCKLLKCETPKKGGGGVVVSGYRDFEFLENSYPCGYGGVSINYSQYLPNPTNKLNIPCC